MLVRDYTEVREGDKVEYLRKVESKTSIFRVEKNSEKDSNSSDFFPSHEQEKYSNDVSKSLSIIKLKCTNIITFNLDELL